MTPISASVPFSSLACGGGGDDPIVLQAVQQNRPLPGVSVPVQRSGVGSRFLPDPFPPEGGLAHGCQGNLEFSVAAHEKEFLIISFIAGSLLLCKMSCAWLKKHGVLERFFGRGEA